MIVCDCRSESFRTSFYIHHLVNLMRFLMVCVLNSYFVSVCLYVIFKCQKMQQYLSDSPFLLQMLGYYYTMILF